MTNKIRYNYAAMLLLSVLIYGIPFHYGESILRIVLAIVIILLTFACFRTIWRHDDQSARNQLLMSILNSMGLFHLGLIFSYLMFESTTTFFIGLVLAALLYHFINNRMKQLI